jgi:hypothetical protein
MPTLLSVIEMGELVIKIPGIELDEKTKSELREDIKSVIRLRLELRCWGKRNCAG